MTDKWLGNTQRTPVNTAFGFDYGDPYKDDYDFMNSNTIPQIPTMDDIIANPSAFADYDFSGSQFPAGSLGTDPMSGSAFDTAGAFDIGFKGLGALGGLYSMFDQAKTNRLNRSLAKRNDARQANEIARRDRQRKSLGSSFSKAGKNIRSSFDNQG